MKHAVMLFCAVLAAGTACSDGGTGPGETEPPRVATSLTKVSGDTQAATVGSALAQSLEVEVSDQHGAPMTGVVVTWAVTEGGGSFAAGSSTSDSKGRAVASWTLGTTAGGNAASARVTGISTAVEFRATGLPGSPAALVRHAGEGQTGPAGEALANDVAVKVVDEFGNGLSGETVSWTATAGNGSPSAATSASDSSGVASVSWTLGLHAGSHELAASHSEIAGEPAGFTATVTPNGRITGSIFLSSSFQAAGAGGPLASLRAGSEPPTIRDRRVFGTAGPFRHLGVPSSLRRAAGSPAHVPGSLIVRYHADAVDAPAVAAGVNSVRKAAVVASRIRDRVAPRARDLGFTLRGVSPVVLAARIQVDPATLEDVRTQLLNDPAVRDVEREQLVHRSSLVRRPVTDLAAAVFPNDPLYAAQAWHYEMIDMPEAWKFATGGGSIIVAVVDDGIRFDHPDLAPNLTDDGFDFVSAGLETICGYDAAGDGDGYDPDPTLPFAFDASCAPSTAAGHGLHVAGTIGAAGNDGYGMTGINWSVKIRPVRVLNMAGSGTHYDIAQGLLYAAGLPADDGNGGTIQAATRADIINLSLSGGHSVIVQAAIESAAATGALIVAAAGNDATSSPAYPAAYPEVISVAAVGPDGVIASYSNYGTTIDIAAPGGDAADWDWTFSVGSPMWDFAAAAPTTNWIDGTSMAAPHVAGVAALLLAQDPSLTAADLRTRLTGHALDLGPAGRDDFYGEGLLNARNSLTGTDASSGALYAALYQADTGALLEVVPADAGGSYGFPGLEDQSYYVFAGQDREGDGLLGIAGRRWGTFTSTGTAAPTPVVVDGAGEYATSVSLGLANELEPNDGSATANFLPVGGYFHGLLSTETEADYFVVTIPAAGTYTFETSGWDGACGFAYEEDTILELLASDGTSVIAVNDDIDYNGFDYCSRITQSLAPGTYYLRVTGYYGFYYRLQAREG